METNCLGILISRAFEKAGKELMEGGVRLSTNAKGKLLAEKLQDDYGFRYDKRGLIDRYKASLKGASINALPAEVLKGLSNYLGYSSYDAFRKANGCLEIAPLPQEGNNRSLKIVITITFLIVFFAYAAVVTFSEGKTKERFWPFGKGEFMVWEGDRYRQSRYDEAKDRLGILYPKDEALMHHFYKKDPDSIQAFFNTNEEPLIWYGTGEDGTYEFFTHRGKHPVTGKELKPITHYIINKYILPRTLKDSINDSN